MVIGFATGIEVIGVGAWKEAECPLHSQAIQRQKEVKPWAEKKTVAIYAAAGSAP